MELQPTTEQIGAILPHASDITFIDSGSFKAVYRARISDRWEAVKVALIKRDEQDEQLSTEFIARLQREIIALNTCRSPFIVKLASVKPQKCAMGLYEYIVYSEEYLGNVTLHRVIKSGDKPLWPQIKRLALCLFAVVKELKSLDIIHRDIKPKNIMVIDDPSRPFVVLDLGIAFKIHGTALTVNPDMRMGTLPYMAPEVFQPDYRQNIDFRSDLYSSAVTLYEYASGTHPIARRGENDYSTLYRIQTQIPTPLTVACPHLPTPFCSIVDQMMKKVPALRTSNIDKLIQTVEAIQ